MRHKMLQFRAALEAGAISESLAVLNAGIAHRYTGIFRLDGDVLVNIHLHDKQGEPPLPGLGRVLLTDSFCQIVLREGGLRMEDSRLDTRVDTSPYQGVVIAYHGVPILDPDDELFGTLCHFDLAQQALPDTEFECLQQAGRLLGAYTARMAVA